MSNLFVGTVLSQTYSRFRPVYPAKVLNTILQYCKHDKNFKFNQVIDVGCGSGQSTFALVNYFSNVIGVDPSKSQIDEAYKLKLSKTLDNFDKKCINFYVSTAEDLSIIQSASVNLLTIAQAMHWVNETLFYKEVDRTLVRGGVLAVYGYGNVSLDKERASEILQKVKTISIK